MFCSDIPVVQASGFINGSLDHLFGAWGQADLTGNHAITMTHYNFYGVADCVQLDTEIGKHCGSHALLFTHKAQEQMFHANRAVLEALSFFSSEVQSVFGLFCESLNPLPVVHLLVPPHFRYKSTYALR